MARGRSNALGLCRYTGGENFGPHTDGCTINDFNCRSLWPMVIYLNTPQSKPQTLGSTPLRVTVLGERQPGECWEYNGVRMQDLGLGIVVWVLSEGGETAIISEEQKEVPLQKDEAGR